MKITIKLALLAGLIFFIVGIIGVSAVLRTANFEEGLTTVDLEKSTAAATIKKLTIKSDIAGIVFVPSDTDQIKAHLTGTVSEERVKDCNIEAAKNGNDEWYVRIRTQKSFNLGLHIGDIKSLFFTEKEKQLRVEVTLPQKAFDEINLSTSIGTIEIPDIQAEKLTAQADTGAITVGRFQGKTLNLETDTGKITVKDGEGSVRLKTDTGSIEANLRSLGKSTDLQSDTGSINLQLGSIPSSVEFDLRNDIGHIDLQVPNVNFEEKEKHSVKAAIGNGDSSVRVQSDTGSIEVRG